MSRAWDDIKMIEQITSCKRYCITASMILFAVFAFSAESTHAADAKKKTVERHTHHVVGLFCVEREADLREAVKQLPDLVFVSADFNKAEVVLSYDTKVLFPNMNDGQRVQRLDNMFKSVSSHTFSIKPLRPIADDKLTLIKIPVAGLDCKACSYGAYRAVHGIDGVEIATASFKAGLVTALIDPKKTNRIALEAALKQRGVAVK